MPMIHISAPEGALNKNDQESLVSRLSDAVLRSEGADPRDPAAQALVWAYCSELSSDQCYVGGKNLDSG
jgi:phenylpyruvate tautomerase PptA (4-oxalocrotonate tautomerase family)